MSLIGFSAVTLEEALSHLSCRSCTPSTMGAQLEALQNRADVGPARDHEGMHVKAPIRDAVRAAEQAESRMLRDIGAIRCLDALASLQHAHVLKDRPALAKMHKAVPSRAQGELVIQCLRAHSEYRRGGKPDQDRALAAVYVWAHSRASDMFPLTAHDCEDLASAFKSGKAVRARQKAAELYADCYLVLAEFVVAWNRKQIKVA